MLKQNLDHDLKLSLKFRDLSDHVSIVTGGNSGTGLAVAKQLVRLGSTVVITCRSDAKCQSAVDEISTLYPPKKHLIIPMNLDLSDLASVKKFSNGFLKRFNRLDILVNNAGVVAEPGTVTTQGIEASFGVMHVGHFALTRYLLKLMLKPVPNSRNPIEASRIVNIASDAFMAGNFHPSFMSGAGTGDLNNEITDNCGKIGAVECCPMLACPHTNGYARAKLANIMHAYELQRRVDEHLTTKTAKSSGASKKYRRLVTSSLHPGSVHTNISTFLASNIVALFLRSSDQAAHIILRAILEDFFVPSSYLDGMGHAHDLFNYQETHLEKHYKAFSEARALPFGTAKPTDDRLSLQRLAWSRQSVIAPINVTAVAGARVEVDFRKDTVAARLWDISEQIVKDWESNRPILKTEVLNSSGSKLSL